MHFCSVSVRSLLSLRYRMLIHRTNYHYLYNCNISYSFDNKCLPLLRIEPETLRIPMPGYDPLSYRSNHSLYRLSNQDYVSVLTFEQFNMCVHEAFLLLSHSYSPRLKWALLGPCKSIIYLLLVCIYFFSCCFISLQ